LQQFTLVYNFRKSQKNPQKGEVDKFCRSFISVEKEFFHSDKIMEKEK